MKKILLPVDFSDYSYNTCLFALQIAKMFESEIHLFHSYFDNIIYPDNNFSAGINYDITINKEFLEIEKNADKDLKKLHKTLNAQLIKENIKNVKIKYSLVSGKPDNTIIDFCKEYKPDIIIMGSRGKGNKSILLGSISKNIMNHSDVPVLAIPESYSSVSISNIMYMTDFEKPNELVIDKIINLFEKFNIKINCIHFNLNENKISQNKILMEQLKKNISEKHKTENISFKLIDSSDINQDIETFINNNDIDLIAFHSHKRNIFNNLFTHKLTKKYLFHTNVPLLSLNT
ncbi:MAG: universal stress protein [Bacteroidales bacterium]|nr:universal stress protein [Bacteroidales bacterium]